MFLMERDQYKIFSDFQKQDFLTDIQLNLSNGSINAHKLVLAANSEFFKMLFNNPSCKEVIKGIVDLPSFNSQSVAFILDYIYRRITESYVAEDFSFLSEVIVVSDFFGVLDLIKFLDGKLAQNFSTSYFTHFDTILGYHLKKTIQKCLKSVIELIQSGDYTEIIKISPEILLQLMEEDGFAIEENMLFDFLETFIAESKEKYSESLLQLLLDNVRSPLLTESRCVKHSILKGSPSSTKESDLRHPRCTPFAFVVNRQSESISSILKVDLVDGAVSLAVSVAASVDTDGCTICVGFGARLLLARNDIGCEVNLGCVVNLVNGTITPVGPVHSPDLYNRFVGFCPLLIGQKLFLLGGYWFNERMVTRTSDRVLVYDLDDSGGVWRSLDTVRLRRACYAHAVVKDGEQTVLVSGGRDLRSYLRQFYRLHLETGEITDLPPLPCDISGHRMEVAGDTVAVFDGFQGHEVLLFSVAKGTWRKVELDGGTSRHLPGFCLLDEEGDGDRLASLEVGRGPGHGGSLSLLARRPLNGPATVLASWGSPSPSGTVSVLVALSVHAMDHVAVLGHHLGDLLSDDRDSD